MQITRGKRARAQKVVIYGPEGIGKSTFAAEFPNAVFIDTEGSTDNMDVARLLLSKRILQNAGHSSSTQLTGRKLWQLITSVRNMVSKGLRILAGAKATPMSKKKWGVS